MDEYLFFQQHKKYLKDTKSVLSPKIFTSAKAEGNDQQSFGFGAPVTSQFMASPRAKEEVKFPPAPKVNLKDVCPCPPALEGNSNIELTAETMQGNLCELSTNYTDQYTLSGFPPKICTLILKEISDRNKLRCQVLDIGCGKGHVGEYLKNDGYLHITGMDCSKNLLQLAEKKKAYEKLERVAIGEAEIDPSHKEKYDFVISASMINNDGWDDNVFLEMLNMVKMGGYIIFATKLNLNQENQYGPEINRLAEEMYWKFCTEHTFYRYDKLCNGHGKFSNKMVKIVAYQKTDHTVWLEQEKDRLEEEERTRVENQALIDKRIKAKEDKLNGAQNRRKERKMLQEKEASMKLDEIQKIEEETKQSEEQAILDAEAAEKRKAEMVAKMKQSLKDAMWTKLKAAQAEEIARRESMRAEVVQRMQTVKLEKDKSFNPAG